MPISQAALDSHGTAGHVQCDGLVRIERDELPLAVGNFVEAVAGAEDFQAILFFDELPDLIEGSG